MDKGAVMFQKVLLLTLFVTLLLAGCVPSAGENGVPAGVKLAPLADLPAEVRQASQTTQTAYRFAVANPDLMKQVPCYCGCGEMGHQSNYQCYVQSDAGGQVVFDQHALGCSICVDITIDAIRMLGEGKDAAEIKSVIDATYSQYGPSNMED